MPDVAVRAYYLPSLKDRDAAGWLRREFKRNPPDVIINTTAFSARAGNGSPLDAADCPIIQAAMTGTAETRWKASSRGLSSTDLAMHVVLPEIDGRLFGGAISFKAQDAAGLAYHLPHEAGISHVAGLARGWIDLRKKPRKARKVALVLSTYPGRPDQIAHAVGLDGPQSALLLAERLRKEGYFINAVPGGVKAFFTTFPRPAFRKLYAMELGGLRSRFRKVATDIARSD